MSPSLSVPAPLLLVEDNPDDALLIRRALERTNLANPIHVAGDGDAAVRYLEETVPGPGMTLVPVMMLLDLKLPRRPGLEVLSWVRREPRLARLPVVVLTGSTESGDLARAYDLGANAYLVKPVQFDALMEILRTLNLRWVIVNPDDAA
jgi:CheY-like chemotaxis protein